MARNRLNQHERRKKAAARAAALAQSHDSKDGGKRSTVPQQPLPHDAIPKPSVPEKSSEEAQRATREETPEPMITDRKVEDITQLLIDAELDDLEAERNGPKFLIRMTNDIAVLAKQNRKLMQENFELRKGLEKEVEARVEYSRQVNKEFRVYYLAMRALAQSQGQDPDEFMQRMRFEAEEGRSFV